MDWSMFAAIVGVMALQTGLLLWIISKLDSDIKASTTDSNAKWMAANARIDDILKTLSTRIDTTQSIIMRMLSDKGK